MKVLALNTFDNVGGAARAARRLQEGVQRLGVDSRMLVHFKAGQADDVICSANLWEKFWRRAKIYRGTLPVRRYPNKPENNFSPSLLSGNVAEQVSRLAPDIIHLHWLCAGFMQIEALAELDRPLVWTLHDSWAFTGGCHVPFDCLKYRQKCGACPVLGSDREDDLSRQTWERKKKAWSDLNLTVVVPSRWIENAARSSSLFRHFRIKRIPYGLDTGQFKPLNKEKSRWLLGLPQDKKIVLFGAVQAFTDPNKGFHLLQDALRIVGRDASDKLAVVFSAVDHSRLPDLGMPRVFLGRVEDDRLAALYSAADVFVLPSRQENLPLTIMEAMACGTPCVAFRQGGLPDQVEHEISGYLADPYDVEALARGIAWVLEDENRRRAISQQARYCIETVFSREGEAEKYAALYREILGRV